MKIKFFKAITSIFILYAGLSTPCPKVEASSWRSGRVISATLSGYGSGGYSSKQPAHTSEIWWNYCIASEDQCYTVVSREKPEKLGMTKDSMIRFSERKDRIQILGPAGKRIDLRLIRKAKGGECP
jgi:hypothetical protein